jgi:hypothetical protein
VTCVQCFIGALSARSTTGASSSSVLRVLSAQVLPSLTCLQSGCGSMDDIALKQQCCCWWCACDAVCAAAWWLPASSQAAGECGSTAWYRQGVSARQYRPSLWTDP